jgi:hypothetical protein
VGNEKRISVTAADVPQLQRMLSSQSSVVVEAYDVPCEDGDEEGWMQRREVHQLNSKLKNILDKREMVFRERKLLTDRVDVIVKSIGDEMEARKKVKLIRNVYQFVARNKPSANIFSRKLTKYPSSSPENLL